MTTDTTDAATIDAITDRINADPGHAELVAGAIDVMTAAAATIASAPDAQAQDAALVGVARTVRELRDRLVADHGEDAGAAAWRDALTLVTWRASLAPTAAS